ncbi:hypothetical protein ACKWTF_013964 [Chironomus riparius]
MEQKAIIPLLLLIISITSPILSQPQLYNFQYPVPSHQILNCVFHYDTQTSTYDCVSTNTTVRGPGAGFNAFDGSHVVNHSDYDVSGLRISSQLCKYVPDGIGDLMPNLKKLQITNSGLLALDNGDLYKFPMLQYLNVRGNRLVELPGLLFHQNSDIIFVDFSDNFIKFIHPAIFSDFNTLRYIDFGNNICVQNTYATDNFREWERELRRNCIPADRYYGIIEPLNRIADQLDRFNGFGQSG